MKYWIIPTIALIISVVLFVNGRRKALIIDDNEPEFKGNSYTENEL